MSEVTSLPAWVGIVLAAAVLGAGTALSRTVDAVLAAPGRSTGAMLTPWRRAATALVQTGGTTERPDVPSWVLGAALYGALAAGALVVVPWSDGIVIADLRNGIVLWGAAEALALVAVYLHGWSSNSVLPLIGAYRFVILAASFELLSMFVLIAVALPAESLQVSEIVAAQSGLWNAVRHPPALPLWLVVTAGLAFWGPLNLADGDDLAGGTAAELSGPPRLIWEFGRSAWLTAASAMGAAALLGGWHGPWLPGPVWMGLKTAALLALVTASRHLLARVPVERFVRVAWKVLLPVAFLDLAIAGIEALR